MEEVDRNWIELIGDRYFNLTQSEIRQLDPNILQAGTQAPNDRTNEWNSAGVFGGVDMFHSLHCVNSLRLALDGRKDYLSEELQHNIDQLHMDHCIEHLRQAILCHGDLTPVTLTPVYDFQRNLLNLVGQTRYPHTCRDWKSIQQELRTRDSEWLH
ncbi:hypothetical protein BT63DRAFT_294852 [Microthyrium microscopicum]|uniref:Uncharacterized protein n=1 Tax=Microthyrium microscopicum TaxID=703497 RepID=A0A6A6U7I1_9PEZI|nr:hypothetical protein BT63DRAFT_294852 [Microthyrium microscopicum]